MMKKIILFFGIFLFVAISLSAAEMTKHDMLSAFVTGNIAYKSGEYQKAIENYESIVVQGKASGNVYYNLANAYFKVNNVGRAILNYERAIRLNPRDGDIKYNYQFVLAQEGLKRVESDFSFITNIFYKIESFYQINEIFIMICAILFLMGVIHVCGLFFRMRRAHINGLLSVLGIIFLVYCFLGINMARDRRGSAIILQKTDSKFEPRNESTTHFKLSPGTKVRLIKVEDDWVKVQRDDGKLGWLSQSSVEKI